MNAPNSRETEQKKDSPSEPSWRFLLNPVVFIAVMFLAAAFVLPGAAILGIDNGVLAKLAGKDFTRGVITYFFTLVTIGSAIVLVVYALTHEVDGENDRQFNRGKDVLSLLLGIFGTIVGFYFGLEAKQGTGSDTGDVKKQALQLQVAPILFDSSKVASGGKTKITAYVSGGMAPYMFGISQGDGAQVQYANKVSEDGRIVTEVLVPEVNSNKVIISFAVKDAAGNVAMMRQELQVAGEMLWRKETTAPQN